MGLNLSLNQTSANSHTYDVIIIGGGPAGASAAIYTARAGLSTLVIDKGITAGALGTTEKISNYPGIPGPISGESVTRIIRDQAESFGAEFLSDKVVGSFLSGETKTVMGATGTYQGRAVIITTGAMGRVKRFEGEERLLGRGVSSCATCDAAFFKGMEVAVIGNNDEALEEALYLTRFASKVTLVTPSNDFTAVQELVDKVTNHPAIEVMMQTRIGAILGEEVVEGIALRQRGSEGTMLPVRGVFIYTQGNLPITDFIGESIEKNENGSLKVDEHYMTSIPGVYAAGDVLMRHVQQAVIAASDGVMAAIAVDKYLNARTEATPDWK